MRIGGPPRVREVVSLLHRPRAEIVLALCREVETDIAAVAPGSPQAAALEAEAARLQHKYHCLIHGPHFPVPADLPSSQRAS